jgi:hypothetical protein
LAYAGIVFLYTVYEKNKKVLAGEGRTNVCVGVFSNVDKKSK